MADAPLTPPLPPELPVVPLRGAVVLPQNEEDDAGADDLHRIGTVAVVRQMAKGQTGMRVLVEGITRARAEFMQFDKEGLNALIKPLAEKSERTIEVDAR